VSGIGAVRDPGKEFQFDSGIQRGGIAIGL
jgi:hypothetical protein